jgi:hypothetical protein
LDGQSALVYGIPGEASGDGEGIQTMRVFRRNMAWPMKLIEHGKGTLPPPEAEDKIPSAFLGEG